MDAFSLLKYWRGSGGGGRGGGGGSGSCAVAGDGGGSNTTIVTAVSHQAVETDEEDDDDGPFFDLEFTVPEEDDGEGGADEAGDDSDEDDDDVDSDGTDDNEREFKFTLSSDSSGGPTDPILSLSPDDVFFNGRLVPLEPSSLVFTGSEANSKNQFPVSLLKSATKFRVFMLRFKKSRAAGTEKTESNGSAAATPKQQQKQESEIAQAQQKQNQLQNGKFFTVKFKVEEVPIVSLFTRDNSSRVSSGSKPQKQNSEESASDEKRFSKDVMQKYLKKVKPLYVRVSRRYGEKLRFSGQLSVGSGPKTGPASSATQVASPAKPAVLKSESDAEATETPASNGKGLKQGNIPAGLRVVCKRLGKSRSASSAVAAAPVGPPPSRRDDSLLQQQDNIQSAILHCKRSFNASRDSGSTPLSRSASDPSREKSMDIYPEILQSSKQKQKVPYTH